MTHTAYSANTNCTISENATGPADVTTMFKTLKDCSQGTTGVHVGDANNNPYALRSSIMSFSSGFLQYAALFAVGAIVVAGVMYTTAYGDGEKLKKAKDTAIYACIGLLIALVSYSLVNAVLYIIYGTV